MTIRDATEADLPAIVAIYNSTIPSRMVTAELEPTTVERRLPWFRAHSQDRHPLWVMEGDGGSIAGWLSFNEFVPRCAYQGTAELSVYVAEQYRRQGVGRRLLTEALARARSLEINALLGLIFAHNGPSLKLFEQFGFERWGFLPRVARLDGVERDLTIWGRHV